jgi:type I restriction-modification system DNA methylase subunit
MAVVAHSKALLQSTMAKETTDINAPTDKNYANALLLLRRFSEVVSDDEKLEHEVKERQRCSSSLSIISNETVGDRGEEDWEKTGLCYYEDGQMTPQKEKAFAKLQGKGWYYYLKRLSVTIGRKTDSSENVDVNLGLSKTISRRHAKIEYNYETKQWELDCIGRNPVLIDGIAFEAETKRIPLKSKYGKSAMIFII